VLGRFYYHAAVSSTPPRSEDPTLLMISAASGDKDAADRLLPLVYEQLRKAAQLHLDGDPSGHTLSATALVHEAFLKLVGPREVAWAGRGHFYAAAAEAMRRIFLDHARSRARRGGGLRRLTEVGDVATLAGADADEIVAVDDATMLGGDVPFCKSVACVQVGAALRAHAANDVANFVVARPANELVARPSPPSAPAHEHPPGRRRGGG
jgi:RNA polymerase sigma factor (TIGR02999 family)